MFGAVLGIQTQTEPTMSDSHWLLVELTTHGLLVVGLYWLRHHLS